MNDILAFDSLEMSETEREMTLKGSKKHVRFEAFNNDQNAYSVAILYLTQKLKTFSEALVTRPRDIFKSVIDAHRPY